MTQKGWFWIKKLNEIVTVVMNDTQELFYDFHRYNPYSARIRKEWDTAYKNLTQQIEKNL